MLPFAAVSHPTFFGHMIFRHMPNRFRMVR